MTPKDLGTLLIVSMLWGGSFLLMRIVVPSLGPVMVAETRVLLAGLALTAFATAIGTKLEFGLQWRQYLILGALNGALPFALISAAELHMTASTAAILNATTPLFGALIAAVWKVEVFTVQRLIGLTTGFVGVAVLVGWNPSQWTAAQGWSVLASLIAAAGYGAVSVYTKRNIQGATPLALAAGSQLAASILLLPLIPIVPPTIFPTSLVLVAVLVLGLFCTAVARVLHFGLIQNIGPISAGLTTHLAPAFGIFWSWLFLAELPNTGTFLGLGLILGGVTLMTLHSRLLKKQFLNEN